MKIWIDFANSPHVLFFSEIIKNLEKQNHEFIFTCRNFAQTVELTKIYGFDSIVVGKHGGKSLSGKFFEILKRSLELRKIIKKQGIDISMSHNSYSQILCSKLMRKRVITFMDYEYQPANKLAFRFANHIFLPESIELENVLKIGAKRNKIILYPGLKENLYLNDFYMDIDRIKKIRKELKAIDKNLILVRPPADMSAYHNFKNPLFAEFLLHISKTENIIIVVLPKTKEQEKELKGLLISENFFFPDKVYDGKELIYSSDIIISAGGTMNREAAVLGKKVYSIFYGKIGGVNKYLEKKGYLTFIRDKEDFKKFNINDEELKPLKFNTKEYIINKLNEILED